MPQEIERAGDTGERGENRRRERERGKAEGRERKGGREREKVREEEWRERGGGEGGRSELNATAGWMQLGIKCAQIICSKYAHVCVHVHVGGWGSYFEVTNVFADCEDGGQ